MIPRHAAAAGIATKFGEQSFRATGITVYLQNGGLLEHAQQMAAHESARTTKLYDRRGDEVQAEEIEAHGRPFSIKLTLPPLAALFFKVD